MDTPKPVTVTVNGTTYTSVKQAGCTGCAGVSDLDLCQVLPECCAPDVVFVAVQPRITTEQYIEAIGTDSANDVQVDGDHYKTKAIQPWDYIAANNLDFFQGAIVKYISRFREKNGIKDLEKVIHFTQKLIEIEKAKQ